MVARGLRAGGRVLAFLCVARLYSVDQVGSFAFLVSVGGLASILADVGLSEFISREVPAAGPGGLAIQRRAIAARLLGVGPTVLVSWLVVRSTRPTLDSGAIGTLLFAAAIGASDFLAAARRARGRFDLEALESGLASVGSLAFAGFLGMTRISFERFQLVLGLATVVIVGVRFLTLWRESRTAAGERLAPLGIAWASRWFFLRAFLAWTLVDAVVVLLSYVTSGEQVAIYAAANRLIGLMTQPFIVLAWLFTPAMAHEHARDDRRLGASTERLNRIALTFLPAGVAVTLAGGRLLLHGFGKEYLAAQPALLLLTLAFSVHFALASALPLIVLRKERVVVVSSVVALVLLVVLCLFLGPTHGAVGGALASVFALGAGKVVIVAFYRREGLPLGGVRHLALLAAEGAWVVVIFLTSGWLQATLLAAGGAASFYATFRLLGGTGIFTPQRSDAGP